MNVRRWVSLLPCTFLLLSVIPASAEQWLFDVYLDKQHIGSHRFEFSNQRLQSEASFDVKLLFINAYRYRHQATEVWQDQCLQQLDAHTEENKDITDVKAGLSDGQLVVNKSAYQKNGPAKTDTSTLPACVMTFAYWHPNMLRQTRLLNPQNAEFLDVKIVNQGLQAYSVRGQTIQATQYQLTGSLAGKVKLNITLWYDQQQWVGLKSVTPEGYNIYYKLK